MQILIVYLINSKDYEQKYWHNPAVMAGLCLFLSLIREHQDRIHMPCGFVDDPKGDVADEEVDDGGFGDDIFAADADGVDVLLLNVGQHHVTAVPDDLCRGINDKGIGNVFESLLHVRSERLLGFIREGDIALGDGDSVNRLTVQQHLPFPGLGVEDSHGDLLSPCLSLLLQVNFYVLQADDISVGCGRTDATRNDAIL